MIPVRMPKARLGQIPILLLSAAIIALLAGCGGSSDTPQPTVPEATTTPPEAPGYDLHEWGVVSAGPNGFEVAAGPGRQAAAEMLTVDKPVLYVHSSSSFDLQLTVNPGARYRVAEHFPVVTTTPLKWNVGVRPESCRGTYPSACSTEDGYCESTELALYETTDAACLTFEDQRLPLLFYRLRTDDPPPVLPLHAFRDESGVAIQNHSQPRTTAPLNHFWRVTWNPETQTTLASRFLVPTSAETVRTEEAAGDVAGARAGLRADMIALGLTAPEGEAFMRGWDEVLFGRRGSVDRLDDAERPADSPVDGVAIDTVTVDEIDLPRNPDMPRVRDAILYWMGQAAIEELATIDAVPPPQNFSRAMLVRVDVQ